MCFTVSDGQVVQKPLFFAYKSEREAMQQISGAVDGATGPSHRSGAETPARSSQNQPGAARGSQEQPEAALGEGMKGFNEGIQ